MQQITNSIATMSSREISDLCDARHNDVVETITRLFAKGVLRESRNTPRQHQPEGGGRPTMIYDLTKRDCLVVVSGYSDELRARIIDRWIELESAPAAPVELSRLELLEMALASERGRLALAEKIAADAPKVEFAEAVRNLDGLCSMEQIAKTLGWGRNRFIARLKDERVLQESRIPFQKYLERGYFEVVEQRPWTDSQGNTRPAFTTMVTGAGQVWLARRFAKPAPAQYH